MNSIRWDIRTVTIEAYIRRDAGYVIYIYIYIYIYVFFSVGSAAQRGLWPPHSRGFCWSHTTDTTQSVGLLWTSDQLVAETSTWEHDTHDRHPCPWWDSNPSSQQTYALDRAATIRHLLFLETFCESNHVECCCRRFRWWWWWWWSWSWCACIRFGRVV